jgi:hypothetical protein
LRRCIRLDGACAVVCRATAAVVAAFEDAADAFTVAQIEACAQVCRACAEECLEHATMHEHCRVCADACRRCAEACEAMSAK